MSFAIIPRWSLHSHGIVNSFLVAKPADIAIWKPSLWIVPDQISISRLLPGGASVSHCFGAGFHDIESRQECSPAIGDFRDFFVA